MWYNYNNQDAFRAKINTTQPKGEQNVKHNCCTPATRAQQPPRPRARDTFSCVVDDTALNVMPFTPPHTIQSLTPVTLGRNAIRGETLTHNSNTTEKGALAKRAHHIASWQRAHSHKRACHGAFRVAPHPAATAKSTSVVLGKILSPLRVFRGRITVGARPRLPWFLRDMRRLLHRCERDIPISKE